MVQHPVAVRAHGPEALDSALTCALGDLYEQPEGRPE